MICKELFPFVKIFPLFFGLELMICNTTDRDVYVLYTSLLLISIFNLGP